MKRIIGLLSVSCCAILASGCVDSRYNIFDPKSTEIMDPDLKLTRDDFRNMHQPKGEPQAPTDNVVEPPVPDIADILAAPKPPKLGETQLVSVAVTDDVPLKDVLIELARLADVDIEVDAGITGGISFRAKDRPFNEVIERIADLAGLRYSMKNGVLRVERDLPYIQEYSLDFLNMERSSTGSVTINTSVLSSDSGGSSSSGSSSGSSGGSSSGGGGLNSGSSTTITTTADGDFWKQFEDSIGKILQYQPAPMVSATTIAAQPAPPPTTGAPPGPEPQPGFAPAAAPVGGNSTNTASFYTLNRQAGTLTISATDRQHEMIKRFISRIQTNLSAQVLIEAKIVEVQLNDKFQSGIDWSQLGNDKVSFPLAFKGPAASVAAGAITSDNVATFNFNQEDLTGQKIDLDLAVELAELFGTTRTLSSPRLHAINNQQAVLTFAENLVYFTLSITQQNTTDTGGNTVSNIQVTSSPHTVPIGIIMTLQPSINTETNEVTLNIRPSLSKVTSFVTDPAVAYLVTTLPEDTDVTGLTSQLPVVQVRELDSILRLKSGQVMVIGGLMSDQAENADQGVPGVSTLPYVGNLFKAVNKSHNMSELVIFIRATIIGSHGNAHSADRILYEKFNNDPRPLSF